MRKAKLLIIADDLTGGLDTGVQFAKRGISVQVYTDTAGISDAVNNDSEVLVVVTQTRHMRPDEAYETVHQIVSEAAEAGILYIYKKTDSALRGNIGSELAAVLDAGGFGMLPFIPAYPDMKRITVDGCHYIDCVPVADSSFGRDPLNPVMTSSVAEIILSQAEGPVWNTDAGGICRKDGITVINAESNRDLQCAGNKLKAIGALRISAGCAGFATFLPELLELEQNDSPKLPELGDGLLVISGSIHPVTGRQLDYAEKNGFVRFHLKPGQNTGDQMPAIDPGREKWMIVDTMDPDSNGGNIQDSLQDLRGGESGSLQRVMNRLADLYGSFSRLDRGTVLVTGGDTLFTCLTHLKIRSISPLLELYPGIVLSEYRMPESKRYIISKSGGFGEKTLLTDLRELIENRYAVETDCRN